jgi:predicted metal-dependent hydrolase
VGWLFFLAWRGSESFLSLRPWPHNVLQVLLIVLTLAALGVFIAIVAEGLLGSPDMFIRGNDSTRTMLRWYEARCAGVLPQPQCFSISIWWYRLLMLLWALWLATALIRWLSWGWRQFSAGAILRRNPKILLPPALP